MQNLIEFNWQNDHIYIEICSNSLNISSITVSSVNTKQKHPGYEANTKVQKLQFLALELQFLQIYHS